MPVIALTSLQALLALFAAVPLTILVAIFIADRLSRHHHSPHA